MSLLVADVDECEPEALDRSARALERYAGVIVSTFSATPQRPKHRIVLVPSRPIAPSEFSLCWAKMAARLASVGIAVDRGCKNVNRLYFACVARSPEAWLGARHLTGEPVDVDRMLAAALADHAAELARRPKRQPVSIKHTDRYARAALEKARANVESASEGGRHDVLLREAYSLARLGLGEGEIADALIDSFVAVAGELRRREGERAIRDAVAARGAA